MFWAIWLVWCLWIEHYNNVWSQQNKMAGIKLFFKMAIKSTLNGFLLKMLRLSILEFISCPWTKLHMVNGGDNFMWTSSSSDWTFRLIHFQTRSICLNLQSWTKLVRKFWFWTYCNHNYDKLGLVFVQKCPPPPPPTPLINIARQNKACETWPYQHWLWGGGGGC